ncbi:MAG: ABC-F family ATP-binding cassette domain-containing protein [Planctomycetota bacterium]
MALVVLKGIEKTWGEKHLLRGISLVVEDSDRIGLVGPNGSGKTTLMRIVAGLDMADDGQRTVRRDARLGYLPQEPVFETGRSIRDAVREGLAGRTEIMAELERIHRALAEGGDVRTLGRRQEALENRLMLLGGHDVEHRVEEVVHQLGLPDADALCGTLSGGERRRVALARLLLSEPDLLLLDEPTNHLDAMVTEWLEDLLLQSRRPLLIVTHDRYFLDRVVDRIVEIDRGKLHGYDGGYGEFLVKRADRLSSERRSEETRLNLLRRETQWMRRGPPARSTKAKARIRRFFDLADHAPEPTDLKPAFSVPEGPRLGSKVIRVLKVTKGYGERVVLPSLDLEIHRGERVGIVGPNGAGKTTLLRLCQGLSKPDTGRVEIGSTVKFAYIDQSRADLNPDRSVVREVGDGGVWVKVGDRDVRVESFLESLLFPKALFDTPVRDLSGGEQNRILIAKLLLKGGNVLVLDEPTNDLDLMTLRVLEEALAEFPGVVLAVSHDRYFLDRVATRIVHLDGEGRARLHPGDVSSLIERMKAEEKRPAREPRVRGQRRAAEARKLTYRQQKELEALPDLLHAAEERLAELDGRLADPGFYTQSEQRVKEVTAERKQLAAEVEGLYARWEELEALK